MAASGITTGGRTTLRAGAQRVPPVRLSLSLGTAPMSPACSSVTWIISLPCITDSPPSRSVVSRAPLATVASAARVPVNRRKRLMRPA